MEKFESQETIDVNLDGDFDEEVVQEDDGDEDFEDSENEYDEDDGDETSEDDDDEVEEEVEKKKDFSHRYKAAMKEERQKRQELQRTLEENRQKIRSMEETFQRFQQSLQQQHHLREQERLQQQIPSMDEDPVGHLTATQNIMMSYILDQAQKNQQSQQRMQESAQLNRMVYDYKTEAAQYSKKTPDFNNAYEFFVQKKQEEYMERGYTPEEAHEMLIEDEIDIVARAKSQGQNPAERVYNVARKYGYQPQRSSLERVEKGMKSNRSLGSVSNEGRTGTMTLEQLASMDTNDPRFDKYWKKLIS
jgi:hypothetical protein